MSAYPDSWRFRDGVEEVLDRTVEGMEPLEA